MDYRRKWGTVSQITDITILKGVFMATIDCIDCKVCGKGFEVANYAVGRRKICSDACRVIKQRSVAKEGMRRYRATTEGKAAYTKYNERYKVKHD